MQIALSIALFTSSSGMYVFGASVHRTHLKIMSLLTSNTPGGITTYIERSAMSTQRQPMSNSHRAMSTEDSMCCAIFPESWATSLSLTSSIKCRSAYLTSCRSRFPTSWSRMYGLRSKMQSGYMFLPIMTSHQNIRHMRKCLNGIGGRWRKWAGTCFEW